MPNDTITIPLSKQGKYKGKYETVINIEDADLAETRWKVALHRKNLKYATRHTEYNQKATTVMMHRVILARKLERELLPNEQVDHIDGNGLNNIRDNLRLATHAENKQNQGKNRTNTSGYKGVSWHKAGNKWRATIGFMGKQIHIGSFDTKEQAYEAYCQKAKELHGEYANHGND